MGQERMREWNREKPWLNPIRRWIVVSSDGCTHEIEAHVAFNNGSEGLVFRRYPHKNHSSKIVAMFAIGGWSYMKEFEDDGDEE